MVKTITLKANGTFSVNWGSWSFEATISDSNLPSKFVSILESYMHALNTFGGSQVHLELSSFRSFCHVNKGGNLLEFELNDFAPDTTFEEAMELESLVYEHLYPEPEPEPDAELEPEPDAELEPDAGNSTPE